MTTTYTVIAITTQYLAKGKTMNGLEREDFGRVLADHVLNGGILGTWQYTERRADGSGATNYTVVGFYAHRDAYRFDEVKKDVTITHCWVVEEKVSYLRNCCGCGCQHCANCQCCCEVCTCGDGCLCCCDCEDDSEPRS